ncbi:MAG: hypothetical protein KIS76_12240 [Pyrinomonadaceae bacterium]|nr:hypothetical protein [Pyrinomonadaceae bacterium]
MVGKFAFVAAFDGLPIVKCTLEEGGGVEVGVGVGVPDEYDVTEMLSKLIRFEPPLVFRSSNRHAPDELTVKFAVFSVVELVVIVDPTFDQLAPLFEDFQSSQLLDPSEPYLAWLTEKVPALERSKFIRTVPLFLTRAEYDPCFRSPDVFPVSASFKYQLPEPSVMFAAAYADLPPLSNPSLSVVDDCIEAENQPDAMKRQENKTAE